MLIRVDTHTHSIASGHAYSTVDELAAGANDRGLAGFVLSDHGPAMPGGPHVYHFNNLRVIPQTIGKVRFFKGIEANIMDFSGSIDAQDGILGRLDFVMAGLHEICMEPGSEAQNTKALLAVLADPRIDAISHPGNAVFPADYRELVLAAKGHGKALEINDSSFRVRKAGIPNCRRIAELCAQEGALVTVGSDAHYWRDLGRFDSALSLLEEIGFPAELVLNADMERFMAFIGRRGSERLAATRGDSPGGDREDSSKKSK